MTQERLSGGQLAAALSNAVVRCMADVSGRGPSRARATIGQDAVFVVVEDTLTHAERELVRIGDEALVLRMREGLQRAMRDPLDREVERLTGRRVIGFMSTNHIDPDLAVEVFVFAPEAPAARTAEGDSTASAQPQRGLSWRDAGATGAAGYARAERGSRDWIQQAGAP